MSKEKEPKPDMDRLLRIASGQDDPGQRPKPATSERISEALRALKDPPEGDTRMTPGTKRSSLLDDLRAPD